MFELEKAIEAWCRAVGANQSGADAAAELKDHLYCAIEKLRAQALSDEDAFNEVMRKMGDAEELSAEFSKNGGLRSKLCLRANDIPSVTPNSGSEVMSSTKLSLIMLVQSLVWAVVMVFAAFTLSGTSYKGPVFTCLFAGWFVSWLLPLVLMDHRKAMRAECALLGRILNLRKT